MFVLAPYASLPPASVPTPPSLNALLNTFFTPVIVLGTGDRKECKTPTPC